MPAPDTSLSQPDTQPDPIVGIDLGTTNSLVAIADAQGQRILSIPNSTTSQSDNDILPSAVLYDSDGTITVGQAALARIFDSPERVVTSVKRFMGRSLADASSNLAYLTYQVIAGPQDTCRIAIPGIDEPLAPEQISAQVLKQLKSIASQALGVEVRRAVVTVPAYFDDTQRQATRAAAQLAGLEAVRIVNEPTAAALAYGIGLNKAGASKDTQHQTIAVYDLGGGTFDISILRVTQPNEKPDQQSNEPSSPANSTAFYEVLSTAGDTQLGGDDVDHLLIDLLFNEANTTLNLGLDNIADLPAAARAALKLFSQSIKHTLSTQQSAQVSIDFGNSNILNRTITRKEFDSLITPWVERTIHACDRAMRDAKHKFSGSKLSDIKLAAVVMVGGSTRIPLVRQRAGEFFNTDPYTALDPDRVVALGAAAQAGIMSGQVKGALLLDVIPLSLGIETVGGAVAKLIIRNSTVPARATETFSTSVDGQTSIKLNVLQGEREMVKDCRSLGQFHLTGLPPMPAGIPKLIVEFLIDANGVLNVSAVEERSGKRAAIQVAPNHGLTQSEVDRMEAESYEHAVDDLTQHRVVDLITNSKLDLKWITERLERYSGKLESDYQEQLNSRITGLKVLIAKAEADWRSVDPNAFAAAKEELDTASVRLQEISITESLRSDQDA